MTNIDVRIAVSESGLTYRAIAKKMGISHEWLSRLMRHTLSPDNKERILSAVKELKEEEPVRR